MHELSMLYQLAKTATDFADRNNMKEVRQIELEIGELAGVFPEIFTDYFPYVAEQYPKLQHAELKIHTVPGEGLCTDCHSIYNIMRFEGECPRCHSHCKKVLGGREVRLKSIAS